MLAQGSQSLDFSGGSESVVDFAKVHSVKPITPSIAELILEFKDEVNPKSGQYIKFPFNGSDMHLSINDKVAPNALRFFIGGSSLSETQVALIDFLLMNIGKEVIQYEISGSATTRMIGKHDVLMISAGTGITHTYSIFLEHFTKLLKMKSEDESITLPKLDLVWGCKYSSLMYCSSLFTDLQDNRQPENDKFFTYHPVVEMIPDYLTEHSSKMKVVESDICSYLLELYAEKDLSKTIIYISGSKEFYDTVHKILVDQFSANPVMIVSDNK